MFTLSLNHLITALNHINPGLLWIIQLLLVYSSILLMLRFFGKSGLFVLMGLFIVAANIQVNKLTMLPGFSGPMPLGNVLIAGTYLCSDTLAEYFSAKQARRGILLAFASFICMTLFIIFTLGFNPISLSAANAAGVRNPQLLQHALLNVFGTAPALLFASLTSFLISQFFDVAVFIKIKKITRGRFLWLRNNVSTLLAALLDNCIFNLLAWRLFASQPLPWHTLIVSYVIGTYFMRVIVSVADTPFIYIARFFIPTAEKQKDATQTENGGREGKIEIGCVEEKSLHANS